MMLIKRRVSPEPTDEDMGSDDNSKQKHINDDAFKPTGTHNAGLKMNFISCLSLITLVIVTVNVYLSNRLQLVIDQSMKNISTSIHDVEIQNLNFRKPVVSMIAANDEWGLLIHVREILRRLGYEVIGDIDQNWDILWTFDPPPTPSLKPHQKVNHFPGTKFVTSKYLLSTSNLSFVPKSFLIPDDKKEFLDFASKHPKYSWVRKNLGHRGVRIQKVQEIDLDNSSYIVQEFIQNPFLIDGRKFDVGIYVIHTSIDPLRVYTFDEEVQFRFCIEDYYPFDWENVASYVIGDKYTPVWMVYSLKNFYLTDKVTRKESFNKYLRSIGKNPEPLWKKMEDMIAMVYQKNEEKMVNVSNSRNMLFSTTRHFFELTRFDFMIDEDLNPHLLESNLSPNLATPTIPQNQHMFEKVIYNTLSLSGVARTDGIYDWYRYDGTKWDFRVNDRDLVVNEELCASQQCSASCGSEKCRTCYQCLSESMKLHLKDAFLEQKSIWSAKRLLPSTSDDDLNTKTANNLVQTDWFKAKCQSNPAWCSK
ncbi:putative tubulin polyglutamylase ttll-15 [Brevipalpus obovatus]|uniref:putative tubulin polyglutamylase ttll-15 n=1 Tax=Brevipalpus obovatus TaxID=246614 RepID=UPI003D9DEC34